MPSARLVGPRTGDLQSDFGLLTVAQCVSAFGSQMTLVGIPAMAVLMLNATVLGASSLILAEYLPAAIVGVVAGPLIDRRSLRGLMIWLDLVRFGALVTVAAVWWLGSASLWMLFVLAGVLGAASAVFDSAAETGLPALVPSERIASANAFRGTMLNLARVTGPACGGAIVAFADPALVLVIDAMTYVLSAGLILLIRAVRFSRPPPSAPPQSLPGETRRTSSTYLAEVRQGYTHLRSDVVLRRGAIGMAVLNLAGGGIGGLFYVYALRVLHLTPQQVGLSVSLLSLGAILGAAASGRVSRTLSPGNACAVLSTLACLALALIPAARFVAPGVLLDVYQLLFGVASAGWSIIVMTLRQKRTRPEVLGRVSAATNALIFATTPIGVVLGAAVANAQGVFLAIVVLTVIAFSAPALYWGGGFREVANNA